MTSRVRVAPLVARAAFAAAVALTAAAEPPWIAGPPFSADPERVLQAAGGLEPPDGAGVDVLFQEVTLVFDSHGRITRRRYWVYRIAARPGLEDWSRTEVRWTSGYQEEPEVRARVLTPPAVSGDRPGIHELDPDALRFPESPEDPPVGWARLPGIRIGAVVEEEAVVRDRRPFSAGGTSGREILVLPAPVRHARLVFDAPIDLPLRFGVRTASLEPVREVAGGRVRLTFELRDLPAAQPPPAGLPSDRPRFPHVAYSTGEGWPEVAAALARQVDGAIEESDPRILLFELGRRAREGKPGDATASEARAERVADVLRALRARIEPAARNVALDGLVFTAPEAILDRGAEGSVDMALLLVAALRADGIPADLALLRAGFDQDVETGLPGAGLFNHALVYVPAGRPLWVDPSDPYLRAGDLPSRCQDRRALVVSPTTRELTRTPAARSQDNRTVTRVHVHLADQGPARFIEISDYHGLAERNQRRLAGSLDPESRRLGYLDYVRSTYRAAELGDVEETFSKDMSSGYRLKLEALDAGRAFTGQDEGAVAIDLRPLLGALPRDFLVRSAGGREDDFVFHEPFVAEWHYWIFPPEGWTPRPLPADRDREIGSGLLTRGFRVDNDVVYARFRFDSGPRRITARQFEAYREAVQRLFAEETLVLWLDRQRKDRKNR